MSDLLSSVAKHNLYKAAGKRNPYSVLWQNETGKIYQITKRIGVHVFILWQGYEQSQVRGNRLSKKYTVGEFIQKFKAIR